MDPMFFEALSIATTTEYNETNIVEFGFLSSWVSIKHLEGLSVVAFSLNGSEDHGMIGKHATDVYQTYIEMPMRTHKLWFKRESGAVAATFLVSALPTY